MMKREQILCDRCCRVMEDGISRSVTHDVIFAGKTVWNDAYEHLCDKCKQTLMSVLNKYRHGYATTRAKLTGGDAVEETA